VSDVRKVENRAARDLHIKSPVVGRGEKMKRISSETQAEKKKKKNQSGNISDRTNVNRRGGNERPGNLNTKHVRRRVSRSRPPWTAKSTAMNKKADPKIRLGSRRKGDRNQERGQRHGKGLGGDWKSGGRKRACSISKTKPKRTSG